MGAFPALMPHQKHAWYAFLAQLAAIAMHRASINTPPADAEAWRRLLRDLTPTYPNDEPWQLIMEHVSHPAFFQPPVPEGNLEKFKGPLEFPDEIDILVTSKNHDIKMTRVRQPMPDHWIYALVTLQTMQGFLGQGNYGISRMNGGFASRPCVGLVPGLEWGSRFRRDVRVLLDTRSSLLERYPHYRPNGGLALLWLEPWDGNASLPLSESNPLLDPYYLEICRRVRLDVAGGRIVAYTRPTQTSRLAAKDQKGNMGDPWTPIRSTDASALSVSRNGFRYDRLQEILFTPDFQPGACQRPHQDDPEEGNVLLAAVMARGQGRTEGIHERRLPIPKHVRNWLMLDEGRDRLARLAKERVNDTGTLSKKALKPALLALLQGGPEKLDFKDERADRWLRDFDRRVDDIFFPMLWDALDKEDEEARKVWQRKLVDIGREILREAECALPVPAARRYRALAAAERTFDGTVFKNFPLLRER